LSLHNLDSCNWRCELSTTIKHTIMTSTYCSKPFAQPNIDDEDYEDCYNIRKSTSEEVTTLQQLKEKLDATPLESKSSLVYAQQVNVDLVNDDHLLLFLYAEGFNVDVSVYCCNCLPVQSYTSDPACIGNIFTFYSYVKQRALVRLLRYWTKRHKLFGDKYTLPLTLYGM